MRPARIAAAVVTLLGAVSIAGAQDRTPERVAACAAAGLKSGKSQAFFAQQGLIECRTFGEVLMAATDLSEVPWQTRKQNHPNGG